MCIWCKLGLHPFYISKGVLGTELDGTMLRRYMVVSKAWPQNKIGKFEYLIINLTILKSIMFLLLATPFCWEVPGVTKCDRFPCSDK